MHCHPPSRSHCRLHLQQCCIGNSIVAIELPMQQLLVYNSAVMTVMHQQMPLCMAELSWIDMPCVEYNVLFVLCVQSWHAGLDYAHFDVLVWHLLAHGLFCPDQAQLLEALDTHCLCEADRQPWSTLQMVLFGSSQASWQGFCSRVAQPTCKC